MSAPPPKKMGLSLYADLLEPHKQKPAGATISGAPVKYDVNKEADEEAAKKKDASLKFQPIKRPQVLPKNPKPKAPHTSSSSHKFSSSTATVSGLSASSPERQFTTSTPQQQPNVQRSNFEDWVGDDEDDYYYRDNRPRGGGRKKKKKNKGQGQETRTWDWDDIYDPTLPNSYADYKGSEEQFQEIRDWKARLYYHMRDAKKQGKNGKVESDEDGERARPMNRMFAPPANLNFAPPSFDNDARPPPPMDDDEDYYPPPPSDIRRDSDAYEPPATFPPTSVPDDATGEDAYLRRMRMSGMTPDQPTPPPPPPPAAIPAAAVPPVPTPPFGVKKPDVDLDAKRAEAQAKIAAFKAKLQKPLPKPEPASATAPQPMRTAAASVVAPHQSASSEIQPPPPPPPDDEPGATISRAPVRYEVPPPPQNIPDDEDTLAEEHNAVPETDQPKSSRPGQKGFAERLLKKYGWEKGQGLGAQGEGITTALIGKVDKRKKLPDKEGGGWAQPANMGKIVGGKRRKVAEGDSTEQDDTRYGKMSEVIKLSGMLNGLDVQKEIEEKNLMQEIGDEMGGQYGNVERVFIWRREVGGADEVFVKFTSQLSALRAVQGMDGVTFAGNEVEAGFWDGERFERGEYA